MHKLVHSAVFVFRRTQVQVCIYFLQPTSDLLGLIQVLAIVFGEEPPVFSRSASRPQPPPYPAAGATPYPATGQLCHLVWPRYKLDSQTVVNLAAVCAKLLIEPLFPKLKYKGIAFLTTAVTFVKPL